VADSLAAVTGNYRQGMALTAQRLADVGALKPNVSVAATTGILWNLNCPARLPRSISRLRACRAVQAPAG
jgi:hypothetical protein